jgi:hypothetical protein
MKVCTKCGETKPLSEFYKASTTRDGLRGDCKTCFKRRAANWYQENRDHVIARVKKWQAENPDRVAATRQRRIRDPRRDRDQHLRRTFGLSLDDYEVLLEAQVGACAICRRKPLAGTSLHVDHDHNTGHVRGLLCFRCNGGLGQFDESIESLAVALDYAGSEGFVPSGAPELIELTQERALALVGGGAVETAH